MQNSIFADDSRKHPSNWLRSLAESKTGASPEEPVRPIILPLTLHDATGNRLELGGNYGLPRIKPPPKVYRDPSYSQTSNLFSKGRPSQFDVGGNSENRFSWNFQTTLVANGTVDNSATSALSNQKKPDIATGGLNCTAYTIGGADLSRPVVTVTADSGVSPSNTTTVSLSSCGGFESQLETSYCENDSLSSNADLKLSFSDDECFVDFPASKAKKKT